MNEIYDTVTAICMVESPTKEGKMLSDDFSKNADGATLNYNDKEMTEGDYIIVVYKLLHACCLKITQCAFCNVYF